MSIKSLAGQTVWYGVSSIAARFVNYLLTPILTYSIVVSKADFGRMGAVYSIMPLMNVLFTYGMETTYFRFVQNKETKALVNGTASVSLLITTIVFSVLLWFNQSFLIEVTTLQGFPLLIQLSLVIITLDAFSTIPFARIRNEGRPKLFALIKVAGIFISVGLTAFFIMYCPYLYKKTGGNSWIVMVYRPDVNPIVYVLIANIVQSAFTLLLLARWFIPSDLRFSFAVWKQMMIYTLPMLVAGLGGMVNETFDRLMLGWWLPHAHSYADDQRGIYNACYKLSILITLFIQAFRMGAEPFFFKQAEGKSAPLVYARVMKFFVLTITLMFLVVSLYIPVWKFFISPPYWEGLKVVPILLLANMSLGIYYNLSIWYKITNRTLAGGAITLIGVVITVVINWLFIPKYSYMACAWATFLCYFTMMVVSYVWGQKHYRVPYAWKKLLAYLIIVVLLFFVHKAFTMLWANTVYSLAVATVLILSYLWFISRVERKEFKQLPVIGKYIK
ncbi:MAG: oligosaccharide flippase family protein [Bacteroidota bacterium]|nr:oligosaccharide flippase family protein [Bacteroidota bacterium]